MTQAPDEREAIVRENLALRVMLGAGCDANNDGLHTIMGKGRDAFCTLCGEMTPNGKSRAWFSEERLERVLQRHAIGDHLPSEQGEG